MPPKATTQDARAKIRLPQQHVRPGRGVPGYTGKNVEVYATDRPRSFGTETTGVISMRAKAEAKDPDDMKSWSRQKLDEKAKELGLDPKDFSNKGEVIAAIEAEA